MARCFAVDDERKRVPAIESAETTGGARASPSEHWRDQLICVEMHSWGTQWEHLSSGVSDAVIPENLQAYPSRVVGEVSIIQIDHSNISWQRAPWSNTVDIVSSWSTNRPMVDHCGEQRTCVSVLLLFGSSCEKEFCFEFPICLSSSSIGWKRWVR